jgi:hypothetical protein
MSEYCNFWKLGVNIEKSKVMVFSRGQLPRVINFLYNGKQMEIDFHLFSIMQKIYQYVLEQHPDS